MMNAGIVRGESEASEGDVSPAPEKEQTDSLAPDEKAEGESEAEVLEERLSEAIGLGKEVSKEEEAKVEEKPSDEGAPIENEKKSEVEVTEKRLSEEVGTMVEEAVDKEEAKAAKSEPSNEATSTESAETEPEVKVVEEKSSETSKPAETESGEESSKTAKDKAASAEVENKSEAKDAKSESNVEVVEEEPMTEKEAEIAEEKGNKEKQKKEEKEEKEGEAQEARQILGWKEWVKIGSKAGAMRAKLDSGARTSSLHAEDVEEFERDGRKWIRFSIKDSDEKEAKSILIKAPLQRVARVKNTDGTVERRYVVELGFSLGELQLREEFTLNDRSGLTCPILIGRNALRHLGYVDCSRVDLASKKIHK